MTTFEKLQARIKVDCGIEISTPQRLYPGYWQRAAGAFVWTSFLIVEGKQQPIDVGSTYSASRLVNHSGKLVIAHGWEIIPD